MSNYITENNKILIERNYDVAVVGGGVAGVSAALAARRKGLRTLLIEKSVMPGGLATLGFIAIYLPLCDGRGRKVIGGIAEELLHLSIQYGYDNLPEEWRGKPDTVSSKARYRTIYSPPEFVVAMDELMEQQGIDVLYDTVFSLPVMEEGAVKAVIVENKSGRVAYGVKTVVDASGDADVMYRAGAACAEDDNWLSFWAYSTSLEAMKKAAAEGNIAHGITLEKIGGDNAGRNTPDWARKYKGTNGWEVSQFIVDGRKIIREDMHAQNKKEESFLALPGMAQFRTTRRICGLYELTEADVFRHFDDSIGCTGDWRKAGPVYEIPYRALISREVKNVVTAGRIIASKGDTREVTRVIPAAGMTGQAAGTAASLAVQYGVPVQDIPVRALQEALSEAGVLLHY